MPLGSSREHLVAEEIRSRRLGGWMYGSLLVDVLGMDVIMSGRMTCCRFCSQIFIIHFDFCCFFFLSEIATTEGD